jgi:hypothetical protein
MLIVVNTNICRLMGTEMVNLYVGPQKDQFHVHKEILCKKIPYFEKMFKGGFKEATEDQATFPEDLAESFDLLLGWVYHNSIRPPVTSRVEGTTNTSVQSWSATNFYVLAEKLCLPGLQDQIVNEYMDCMSQENIVPGVVRIRSIYSTTPAGNPFRKFAARSFHWTVDPSSKLDNTFWPTADLAEDILTLLRTGVKASDPRKLPRCEFHCHGKDEPCPTKKGSKD